MWWGYLTLNMSGFRGYLFVSLSDTMHIMDYYGYFAFFLSEKNVFVSDFKTVHRIDSRYSESNKCRIWE